MNRIFLIHGLAYKEGYSDAKSKAIVDTFFGGIADALIKGDRVEIRGFGSFKIKEYPGYVGRNPKTGQKINVKPKKMPFFKAGRELRERVDY